MRNDELASAGIRAYQSGDFPAAVEYLAQLIDRDPCLWTCRFYLAMSYQYAGDEAKAREELVAISESAADQSVKKKTVDALKMLQLRALQK